MRAAFTFLLAIVSLAAAPALAQEPAAMPSACAAEKQALETELSAVRTTIADIATGRWHKQNRKKRKLSGGDVAKAAGGAAASILLPFPFGLAANAVSSAGKSKGPKGELAAGVVEPDVPALIARQQAVEGRLAEIGGC